MRPRAALLAAVSLLSAAAAAAPPAPPAPPALLVLRAACGFSDRAAFDESRLRRYAVLAHRDGPLRDRPVRVLGYDETCGPAWRTAVARGALHALAGGGVVSVAGWAGAGACAALAAAARALGRATPASCAVGAARAAAAAELARRLRWRRALLPPAGDGQGSACGAALRAAGRALAAAGVAVRRAPLTDHELARDPHVVVLCWTRAGAARPAGLERRPAGLERRPTLLLLLLEESGAGDDDVNDDAFQLSNITLDVGNLPYDRNVNLSPSSITSLPENTNLSSIDLESYKKSFPSPATPANGERLTRTRDKRAESEQDAARSSAAARTRRGLVDAIKTNVGGKLPRNSTLETAAADTKTTSAKNKSKAGSEIIVNGGRQGRSGPRDPGRGHITFISELDDKFRGRLLLLTHKKIEDERGPVDINAVYDDILSALHEDAEAERTRIEAGRMSFFLYEISRNESGRRWKHIANLLTASARTADEAEEWEATVEETDRSRDLNRWAAPGETADEDTSPVARWAGGAALVVAAVAVILAAARGAASRRRRRRRRADAVLSPSDFVFPVDERRRLGEGMEAMLSCWLQQLHEFGGPELERPDLLKQPPLAAPLPPSAPSSTCSINRVAADRRIRYKGDAVHMKYLPSISFELKRKATDVLLVMQSLRHENLNPFIGCLCEARPALVFDHCGRGSLEDVLMADDIKLDWTFRLSLLTDLVKGMRYLHGSPLRVHGRLSSRNCVIDSRWVLRLTDYGVPGFLRAQALPQPPCSARELLWTAPELIRETRGAGRGSQPGDVFSFAIIMQEVIVRGEPYCMLSLTPEEIVEKLSRPPPLIRPSVSMGAAPPEAVSVMRQCWSEAPDLRPDFHRLHDIFRHLHRGRKINIVDSMFEMLEKYSNNLEELIRDRTEQLDMEKKKTEQLLNRMLPRSVAERLMLGSRVEPEEFEEVSIYFSDIVGFTSLAARSTPVQVVDLLNDLYTTFDAAIEQYRVYKVETIGDAYMVVGGLPTRTRDHAESVATMALHLLHLAGCFRVRHLPATPLRLRIGLHSGPCCAGVVGLTMPRYCLFGDTVNTASRMESTGAAFRIQVSAATAERLTAAGGYRLRSRGLTQIKGKGAMHTYWLLGKDGFDKPLPTPPALESEEVLFETDGENDSEVSSAPSAAAASPAKAIERQRSDPTSIPDKYAWQRSGAVSADSSPPRAARAASSASVGDPSSGYARYRCLTGSGVRVLRRQWSLERGEALAAAAAAPGSPPAAPEPLALLAAPPPRPPVARYRTRPDRPEPPAGP